jgi:hypothetical protein
MFYPCNAMNLGHHPLLEKNVPTIEWFLVILWLHGITNSFILDINASFKLPLFFVKNNLHSQKSTPIAYKLYDVSSLSFNSWIYVSCSKNPTP